MKRKMKKSSGVLVLVLMGVPSVVEVLPVAVAAVYASSLLLQRRQR